MELSPACLPASQSGETTDFWRYYGESSRVPEFVAGTVPRPQIFLRSRKPSQQDNVVTAAGDALDVFDFEAAARRSFRRRTGAIMASGIDGEETLKANREGFTRYQLRPRRFVDVSRIDYVDGAVRTKLNSPIALCPVGSQRAFHDDGELAAARAAQAKGHLQILSTQSSLRRRGCHQGARRTDLVSALHDRQLRRHDAGSSNARKPPAVRLSRSPWTCRPAETPKPRHASGSWIPASARPVT